MMDLLILHGALGSVEQLQPLAVSLSPNYNVYTLDFSGHGAEKLPTTPFSISLFASDVLRFMDSNNLKHVSILGYSMGVYVAMYLAKHHPDKVNKIITLATKYEWSPEIAAREVKMLDPEKIEQKLPAFAATLAARHTADWKEVLHHTAQMMLAMGANNPLTTTDYPAIPHPVLILLGDRDKMVTLDETLAVYKALPNAQLGILPATSHPIEQVNVSLLSFMVDKFFKN